MKYLSKEDLKIGYRKYLKYVGILGVVALAAALMPSPANAQVRFGISIGSPGYDGPAYYGTAPVCSYGYYPYYPYQCAPYGYYGSDYFFNGVFIGAGPWFHSARPYTYYPRFRSYGSTWYRFRDNDRFRDNRGFRDNDRFRDNRGFTPFRGNDNRQFRDGDRGGDNRQFRGGDNRTFQGGGQFRGGNNDRGFQGGGGQSRGNSGSRGNGNARGGGGGRGRR